MSRLFTRSGFIANRGRAPVGLGETRAPEKITDETRDVVEWLRLDHCAAIREIGRIVDRIDRGDVESPTADATWTLLLRFMDAA